MTQDDTQLCPCGSKKSYLACCYQIHEGAPAKSPEQLMRSRYSAFVHGLDAFLLRSWHSSTRPPSLDLSDSPQWMQLQIIASHQQGSRGRVHFRALFRDSSGLGFLEEKSDFIRENGHWFYVAGDTQEGRIA
ncbi:YchJ family protein [Aliidiomarina sp. Khilg15.8]